MLTLRLGGNVGVFAYGVAWRFFLWLWGFGWLQASLLTSSHNCIFVYVI